MYCSECGFHQSEAHKYCGRCGALLIVENQGTGEITGPLAVSDEEAESGAWGGPALDGPTLAVRSGGPAGAIFSLDHETVTIGRSPRPTSSSTTSPCRATTPLITTGPAGAALRRPRAA